MTAGFDNQPPDPPSWTQLLGINLHKLRLALLLVVLLGIAGWYGHWQFQTWQHEHLLRQGQAFLAKGDYRSAALSAQRVLQLDPNDVEAARMLASIADRFGSPASIFWYGRVAQLQPGNLQDALAWASAALRFGELMSADQALSTVSRRGRQTAAFHQTAAALALALQRYPLAEQHYAAAARLDPANEMLQLNLATVRLESTNASVLAQARAELERLRRQPRFETLALRALAVDADRHHDSNRALQLTRDLLRTPQAVFNDHLAYLDLLHRANDPAFDGYLRQMQTRCGSQPGSIYTLLTWMNTHSSPGQSLVWAKSLPPTLAAQLPIPLAVAEASAMLGRWADLQPLVADANWGPLDCIRLAFYARLQREQNQYRQFESKWQQALNAAQDNPQLRALLARLVAGWGWKSEAETVWWSIANGDSGQLAALETLYRTYTASKDTAKLYRVTQRICDLNPADLVAKNNLAQLSLLLGKDVETGRRLALENFQKQPTDPALLSTYAFSLYQEGRSTEALKLFRQLQEPLLRQPSLAAYYGVVLAANGDREEAARYLALADKSPQLLPEEQDLVLAALAKLRSR